LNINTFDVTESNDLAANDIKSVFGIAHTNTHICAYINTHNDIFTFIADCYKKTL